MYRHQEKYNLTLTSSVYRVCNILLHLWVIQIFVTSLVLNTILNQTKWVTTNRMTIHSNRNHLMTKEKWNVTIVIVIVEKYWVRRNRQRFCTWKIMISYPWCVKMDSEGISREEYRQVKGMLLRTWNSKSKGTRRLSSK